MILGIGTDILKIQRIQDIFSANCKPFIDRVFTPDEIIQASERSDSITYFATRFAGKEAVFKSMCLDKEDIRLNEIEILGNSSGRPKVILHGKAAKIASEKGILEIHISLSYDTDYAIAFATAQG